MDVARIEAISPKQIDWRKLTSKEIIKYDNQGISVPDVYLQWAKNFLSDVSSTDKDETTYEMAAKSDNKSLKPDVSNSVSENSVDSVEDSAQVSDTDVSETEDSEKTDGTEETEEKSEDEMTAAEKREKMQSEDGIFSTAISFINISKQNTSDCEDAEELISTAQTRSADEIAELDSYMNNLLSNIEDLKSQLTSEQNKKGNRTIEAIKKLNQQIKSKGQSGQSTLAGKEAVFQTMQGSVGDFSEIIDKTAEYGEETIDIGVDLMKYMMRPYFMLPFILGLKAAITGSDAKDQADSTNEVQAEAHKQIHDGISNISGYKNDLQDQTGVEAFSIPQNSETNNKDSQNEESNTASATDTKQAVSKDDSKSNSPELDESIKAHSSLDEILKLKLRKGENIEA